MQTIPAKLISLDTKTSSFALQTGIVITATLFIAVCAHFSIPLPFSPVPMTLQNFAVLLVGLALGPRLGFIALCTYLAEGVLGLPVFNPLGLGGIAQLLGPTGGYLMSYPVVAFAAGFTTQFLRRWMPAFTASALGCLAASLCLFASGAAWLLTAWHLSTHVVWLTAVAPFLPGEVFKVGAAAAIYSGCQNWLSRKS